MFYGAINGFIDWAICLTLWVLSAILFVCFVFGSLSVSLKISLLFGFGCTFRQGFFAVRALRPSSLISPPFFGPVVLFTAQFAPTIQSAFTAFILIEFLGSFSLSALATSLFLSNHLGASFKQKIKPPSGQLRKRQPAQLVSQWGRINYNAYLIIKQFVPVKSTGWHRDYTTMYGLGQ